MSELTIQDIPADVIEALQADASRTNSTVQEVVHRVLKLHARQTNGDNPLSGARQQLDRIRMEIEQQFGTLDVVLPLLREDRNR